MKKNEIIASAKKVPFLSGWKLDEAKKRIVSFILKNNNSEQIMGRISLIASALHSVRDRNKAKSDGVWRLLIETLFAQKKQDVLLDGYWCTRHFLVNNGNGENAGLNRLMIEFFKFLGGSVDNSIIFCLYLFEIFHKQFVESNTIEKISTAKLIIDERFSVAYDFIALSVALPERAEFPQSLWFHNLMRAAQSNKAAMEVFRSIIAVISDGGSQEIKFMDFSKATSNECVQFLSGLTVDYKNIVFAISSEEDRMLTKKLMEGESSDALRILKNGQKAYSWFLENRNELMIKKKRKCEEIMEKPSRGLRSNGADHIKIAVSTLYASGIKAVVFHPEGYQFPDMKVRVMVSKWTPHFLSFEGELRGFELIVKEMLFVNGWFKNYTVLKEMLECIIIDALHRIVVVQREEMKNSGGTKKTSRSASACEKERVSEVRPHFRKLPEGWQASEEAKAWAESQQGWKLPPGRTFVRGHYRNGQIDYGVETEPIIIYDDEFLWELI
ncbi:MAG: hypothetical protein WC120_04190 [Parcubacteria group bacterium]